MNLYLILNKSCIIIIFLVFIYFIIHFKNANSNQTELFENNSNNSNNSNYSNYSNNSKINPNTQDENTQDDNTQDDNTQDENTQDDNTQDENTNVNYFDTYGPTNLPNPKTMSAQQRLSFKYTYPPNMTLQDYVNWLLLYKDDTKNLSKNHFINLTKLLRGQKLIYLAGALPPPNKISPPLTSKDLFDNCYLDKTKIMNSRINSIPNRMTGPIIPYNYINYSNFNQNYDVYGLTGRNDLNPDLPDKKNLSNFKTFLTR